MWSENKTKLQFIPQVCVMIEEFIGIIISKNIEFVVHCDSCMTRWKTKTE